MMDVSSDAIIPLQMADVLSLCGINAREKESGRLHVTIFGWCGLRAGDANGLSKRRNTACRIRVVEVGLLGVAQKRGNPRCEPAAELGFLS
jgi:hypothetical protein